MANIVPAKKRIWSTPVIRKLSGAEAEETRKLFAEQFESREEASAMDLR